MKKDKVGKKSFNKRVNDNCMAFLKVPGGE